MYTHVFRLDSLVVLLDALSGGQRVKTKVKPQLSVLRGSTGGSLPGLDACMYITD